ncbi:MAG TPA: DUF5654 family protein [Candidatus Moranbacteria bacterium]|nr:DUF5654 family protein [Candidatus Moranbacteria bacterium]
MDKIKKVKEKVKEEIKSVRKEVKDKTIGYIVTALGLVAGLAWNDAIRSMIDFYFPLSGQGVWAKIIYAAVLTVFVALFSLYLVRIAKRESKKKKNN